MLKQLLIYLLVSIFVVFFASYVHMILVYLDIFYTWSNVKLAVIFSQTPMGILTRKIFILTLIPIIISGIPAITYRLVAKKNMPYFFEITWIIWLMIVLAKILIV